ncbi:pyruvate kinase [Candidatus Peregrinibacteria bacterium]|nr:pyruvate kinase [Candidatus Peregrinibacteria bacterium]
MENRTKIICTIGPASQNPDVLKKMISAGMDCARLNFSHGDYEQFAGIIKNVRALSKSSGRQITVIQDLQGPKIRVGDLLNKGISVKKGQKITLSILKEQNTIPMQYKDLPKDVKKGNVLLIDDGLIEISVIGINSGKTKIFCIAKNDGVIKSHKGINAPFSSISASALTLKDKRDIDFGVKHDVDYIALSFVKSAKDIFELKKILRRKKSHAKVIAKIERHEAIANLEQIIKAADAVMVARGDLGIEIPAEQVPLQQKKIIHLCNTYGKPVIVATQMLDSMITHPRATRAEISDAATAIFDHADAFMLSNETAVGNYPVEATRTLAKVATAVEKKLKNHVHLLNLRRPEDMPITNAACLNACKLANDIHSKFIVAITRTGYTAREIAKYRPFIPIIVFTPEASVARRMSLVWDVNHCFVQFIHLKNPLPQIRKTLIEKKLAKKGDEIVVCNAGFGRKEKLITTTII